MRLSSVVTPCKRFRGTENATLAPESWVSLIFLLPLVTRLLGLGPFVVLRKRRQVVIKLETLIIQGLSSTRGLAAVNKAIISGEVRSYGPRIQWTQAGKAQTSLTLVLEKAGYHTYIPCLIVGNKAEEVAETINGGDYLIVEGSLSWKAGRTKEAGKLQVVAFDVERITESAQDERTEIGEGDSTSEGEIVAPGGKQTRPPTKKRRAPSAHWQLEHAN
jgi:single-stranded DNA-binding protein